MKPFLFFILLMPVLVSANVENNKKVVTHFYEMTFNKHKPIEAVKKYMGKDYTQHNPNVADGEVAFVEYAKGYLSENPKAQVEIKRVIAEGDLVVLHVLSKKDKTDPGKALVDIFRVKDSKIVEHWDVSQDIPKKPENNNSMF